MKRASIDIGSNTTLLLLGEVQDNHFNEHENESRVTGLGRDLDKNKKFLDIAMDETFQALTEYREMIISHGIDTSEVIMTATEASRVATNSKGFFEKVKNELGLQVTIINGDGEAYYTSYGVIKGSDPKPQVNDLTIMDIGGASTEFIKVKVEPFEFVDSISLPFGSVRATDWLQDGVFEERMNEVISSSRLRDFKTSHLFCVAGSMTSLGGMIKGLKSFDANEVNGTRISFNEFLGFKDKIKEASAEQLEAKYPFLGKRARSIVGGALLGEKVGSTLGIETFEISTLGLRYGTLLAGGIDERYRN